MENDTMRAFYERVSEKLESLSKMERKAVSYMVENQGELIYTSITELADRVGTSEATITRVCTKLGYRGFQELKVNVARESVTLQEKIHEDLKEDSSAEAIIDKIFSSAIQTLEMTRQALDSQAVSKGIEVLCRARQSVVMGNGNAGAIAMDAAHKFLRIGLNAVAYTDGHLQMIAVVSLTPEDVVIAFSHSGSSKDVIEAVKEAKERKATVMTVTKSGNSPVAKYADIRLFTRSQETKYRTYAIASRMAELTIIDTLYTGVSLRLNQRAITNFEALENALVVKKY